MLLSEMLKEARQLLKKVSLIYRNQLTATTFFQHSMMGVF